MNETYWRLVEPIWDTVSISDGAEEFLKEFNNVGEKERNLYAAHWTQSEILNGGLAQFFTNPTGVLAPEAVNAFNAIGMPQCASILAESMKFFGASYPRDRAIREQVFEEFLQNNVGVIPIEQHEDSMATAIEDENGGFESAANRYANQ